MIESDESARRLIHIASRQTAFSLLVAAAATNGLLTRSQAAVANSSTAESADLVLAALSKHGLMEKRPRRGRKVVYELTEAGQLALTAIRQFGAVTPPPPSGWWIAVKRRASTPAASISEVLLDNEPVRVYRCVGDFDFLAVLDERDAMPGFLDALEGRLRDVGVRNVEIARSDP